MTKFLSTENQFIEFFMLLADVSHPFITTW